MTKDLLIIGAVVALVAIMILAALPEIKSAMPEVYYVEPTEPETAVEAKAETVLQSTANIRYALTAAATKLEKRSGISMRKPTTEEILAIDGSVPVEMAARYLGQSKDFIYCAMQKQVLPIGTAYLREKEWCYDIRPQALVEYNEHGGVKRYMALEDHLRKVISCTVEKLCS